MTIHLHHVLGLAIAGAIGTLARYFVSGWVQHALGDRFPWGTLAVNALGCFLFGLVSPLAGGRMLISGPTRFIILTGFMGAFTTYSTYTAETEAMMTDGEWIKMGANILIQHVCGFILFFAGSLLGRMLAEP